MSDSFVTQWTEDPDFSVHGIYQAKILERVEISFSRGYSWPRDWTHISCLVGRFFTTLPAGKPKFSMYLLCFPPNATTDLSSVNFSKSLCTSNNSLLLHFFPKILPPIASYFNMGWWLPLNPFVILFFTSFLWLDCFMDSMTIHFIVYFLVLLCSLILFHYNFDRFLKRSEKSIHVQSAILTICP